MAGQPGRSGGAHGGPQYNPVNISATGGNGQSGKQPMRYVSGLPYGQGQEMMAQQASAPMAKAAPAAAGPLPQLRDLLSTTAFPEEPITAGVDYGPGPGSDVLPKNIDANTRPDENKAIIDKYMPALLQAAQMDDAPDSYKRFVNYLLGQ